ncbi:conserved exported hypothetical protein [Bradyrhizobium sp. ORS 375]|uniref:GCG_CRPN prefix-to-repeats domain-containing protein n=1 Tax=Bradyrhizobium sp. (strain ORS 375) TaxID=566679 RepID=UPI0002405F6B|nr:hypothetical protein [Bradyrhizobium sp. ORS 375]CCD96652.1 conserved exported hypothetical protein [Bradyrhizobium sp. ORS 375]
MRTTLKSPLLLASLILGILTTGASAMPLAAIDTGTNPEVIQVAGGCGRGWHRGPYGGCLRNFANPAAHACPRGFHIGPYGRCRGNGR